MRMPALVRSWMLGAMVALSLGSVGCSSYFTEIANVSPVRADVASEGKIAWTLSKDDQGNDEAKAVVTEPKVKLTLDANSAPINFTTAQAEYYKTEGAFDENDKLVLNKFEDIPVQFFPFATQLKTVDRATVPTDQTIPLVGSIPINLVDITNPTLQGFQRLTAVVAKVTLKGSNGFGGTVSTTVNVPISITYQ